MDNTNIKDAAKHCLNCSKPISGRSDKKFCSHQCRSELSNHRIKTRKTEDPTVGIIKTLQTNRKILQGLLKNKMSCLIEENSMIIKGYNPVFHTHITKNGNREVTGCFEFGMIRYERKKIKIFRLDRNKN